MYFSSGYGRRFHFKSKTIRPMQIGLLIKLGKAVFSVRELSAKRKEEMIKQRGIGVEKMYFC